jgi:hypothetical protein
MKTATISFFAGFALALQSFAQAPVGPGAVKLGKVEVSAPNTPEFQVTGGTPKRSKILKWIEIEVEYETVPEDIDELTFKFTAMVEKKLLEGDSTYVTIGKGKDHFAVVYISPKTVDKLTGGKPLTAGSIENVWVQIEKSGQVLAKGSYRPGNMPNLPHLAGLILTKDETPFAPLYYDRYEVLKKSR